MKPWQHGFELDYLKKLEGLFSNYNEYAQHELSKFKKNNIADALSKKHITIRDSAIIHHYVQKTNTPIYMFSKSNVKVLMGTKYKGDMVIKHLGFSSEEDRLRIIKELNESVHFTHKDCWLYINEEDEWSKYIANKTFFVKVGAKFSSVADVIGIYTRPNKQQTNFDFNRPVPSIPVYETYTLKPTVLDCRHLISSIKDRLQDKGYSFTNHYSNYNPDNVWSAISLRGYFDDWKKIEKPIEMGKKYKADNPDWEKLKLRDTELRKEFPEVEQILEKFNSPKIHRVRFMKLGPGGGELFRHTDQVDPDSGLADGQVPRFHIPIITNKDCKFTQWTTSGSKAIAHMPEGSCWYLDTRKPHRAINGGNEDRIHLVIDLEANDKVRSLFSGERIKC
tara:strand:- start:3435 stop:4610 length:1176 start_codon:yes stop_codon:yes gene_type:complete